MSRRRYRRWAAVAGVAGAVVLAVFVYLWLDMRKANEMPAPPDETTQTPVVEPPAPEKLKTPPVSDDNGQAEAPQVETTPLPQRETQEEPKGPNGTLDPVAEAWAVVNHIKENLHKWGTFSREAKAIMDRLMPVWTINNEAAAEESLALFIELDKYRDPRSAEVLAAYLFESGSLAGYSSAMVDLGPPSIPFIMPYFKKDYPDLAYAVKIFMPVWQTHRELLDGVAKHLVKPELERSLAEKEWQDTRDALNQLKAALE